MKTIPEDLTLEGRWKIFIKATHPNLDENSIQYKESRKIFFSGIVDQILHFEKVGNNYGTRNRDELTSINIEEYKAFIATLTSPQKDSSQKTFLDVLENPHTSS